MSQALQSALGPGSRLDRYEIVRPVGLGQTGRVWLATYAGKHGFVTRVAIKTLLPDLAQDPQFCRMLLEEAKIAARLEHPNVAQVLDVGEDRGTPFVVFEWVDGVPLLRLCRSAESRGRLLARGTLLRVVADVCRGLHATHELTDSDGARLGLVHRDVTPENILVGRGNAKLIDFGMAKVKGRTLAETRGGTAKGAPRYMAPEQALGRAVDRRTDVWGLGAVLYRGLTGAPPFDTVEELARFASGGGEDPLLLPAEVPPALAEILHGTLRRDPRDRFADADRVRVGLEEALGVGDSGSAIEDLPPSSTWVAAGGPPRSEAITEVEQAPASEELDSEPLLAKSAVLGRYIVLEPIGRGGMGVVYAAYDPVLDRRVAVKLLRRASRGSHEQERLRSEAMVMARLSHPNVVAVHDVGTFAQRLFVAMELVVGQTLRAWSREPRAWRESVAIYLQAGRGLAAAHAAGIVHRDFKPDNALVGTDGRLRVVDFGLAWLPDVSSSMPGDFPTGDGSIVGTPRYCPPEQLEGGRVDARADQYAFCASLWEALFGEPAYTGDGLLTLLEHIRHGKGPRAPAGNHVPGHIVDALARGLSPDPEARFPSMDRLLEALVRDPGRTTRRVVAAAVGLAAIASVAFVLRARETSHVCVGSEAKLAGIWDGDRRAAVERVLVESGKPWARETAASLSRVLDGYASEWVAMHRDACEATGVRHEQSEALLDRRMQCLSERAAELRSLTRQLSEPGEGLLEEAPKAVYSLTPLRGCADARALLAPVPPPSDAAARDRVERVRMELANAKAMKYLAHYAEAKQLASEQVDRARALAYSPLEAEALEEEADDLEDLGSYPEAAATFRQALLAAERGMDRARAASVMVNLVWVVGVDLGEHERAHEYAQHAQAILDALGGDPILQGDLESFESSVLRFQGRLPEALARARATVVKRRDAFGVDHPGYAMALNNLAAVLADLGESEEEVRLVQQALAIQAAALGEHHPSYALTLSSTAAALDSVGRSSEALPQAERALRVTQEALGPDHVRAAECEWTLAVIEMSVKAYAEAEAHLRHAIHVGETSGAVHRVASYTMILAHVLSKEGRFVEAEAAYRRALAVLERDGDGSETAEARSGLGLALLGLGRPADAIVVLEPTLAWLEKGGSNARELAHARMRLARALWVAKGGDRVRERAGEPGDRGVREGPRRERGPSRGEGVGREQVTGPSAAR
jgi:serine/threonine protein kinase/tetratricopeptide (TPR) repeat protein